MKLRLPHKLQAALLAACAALALNTAAAATTTGTATFTGGDDEYTHRDQVLTGLYLTKDMTTGTATGGAMTLDNAVNIWGGNLWAGSYTVSIWVSADSLKSNQLLFAYSGSLPSNGQGANGIYWNAENKTITIGQGGVTNNYGGFSFHSGNTTVSNPITLGDESMVNFTFSVERTNVTSSSGNMVPTVWVNGESVKTLNGYGGNMNGSQNPITLYDGKGVTYGDITVTNQQLTTQEQIYGLMGVSSTATAGDLVWAGTSDSSAWNTEAKNWTLSGKATKFVSGDNATFGNGESVSKEVSIASSISAGTVAVNGGYTFNLDSAATLTAASLSIGSGASLTISGGNVTVTNAMALTSSDSPAIHVKDSGTLTIDTASKVDNQGLGKTGETGSAAFTKIFQGKAVSVEEGGKLVLKGNINTVEQRDPAATLTSGVDNLEIQGSLKINTWGPSTYKLGDHSMKVTGDAWFTNRQYVEVAGGTFEAGRLLLGHSQNTGDYPAKLTATGGSKVILGGIGLYGPNNSVSITDGDLTFNATDASANVLAQASGTGSNNTVKLDGVTLHSGTNGWTLQPITGATVTVTGTTTLDVAAGKTINLTASSINGTFAMRGGGEANIHGSGTLTSTINVDSSTLTLDGTYAIDGLEPDADSEITFIDDQGQEHKDGSGFRKAAGTKSVYTTTGQGASVTWSDATKFTVNGAEVEVGADGKYHFESTTDYTTLWVNNGQTVGYAAYKNGEHGGTLSTVRMQEGGNLTLADGDTVGTLQMDGSSSTTNETDTTATIQGLTGSGALEKLGGGKLVLSGDNSAYTGPLSVSAGTLEITNANSLGSGTHTVDQGAAILLTNNNMSTIGTLNVQGDGDLRLVTGKTEGGHGLRTVSANNLKLQDNGSHNGRFMYENGSDLTGVNHLYLDGAQLWINGKNLEFTKAVTFNGSTFTGDSGNLSNAAIRQGNSNTVFSGAVEIAENTRLTWDANTAKTSDINFAGTVRGGGDLELLHYRESGTFTISGDASEYAGKITSDSSITLRVTDSGKLHLAGGSNLQGSVRVDGNLSMDGNGSSISGAVTGSGKLAKTGEGTTQVSGSMANYTGSVDVEAGMLNIMNAANLSVKDITIGTNATMGVYSGTEAAEANEGKVTMTSDTTLKAGAGAKLIADLEMQSGSTLTVADAWMTGGLTMGSDVYLNTGNLLGEGDLTDLGTLEFGQYYNLFKDVENLYINGALVTKLDFKDWLHFDMDASRVYANVTPQTYALVYRWDGSNVGSVALTLIPEPTTGTLSLLALCALAARRRRK